MNEKYANLMFLFAGIVIGAALFNFSGHNKISSGPRKSAVEGAFVLGVSVKFQTIADKDNFKELIRPVADFVSKYELNTISYEVMESDKEPTQIYILERYKTKFDYLEVHRKGEAFLVFRGKFQELIASGKATLDGHSYIESNIGFV